MNTTEKEEKIIETMLEVCMSQSDCKEWIADRIQASYSKAEGMRAHSPQATQAYYADILTYARIRFYLDELTNNLPA